jgi:hypothetical protein
MPSELKKFGERAKFASPIELDIFDFAIKKSFNSFLKRNKNRKNITFACHREEPEISTISI